MEHDERDVRLGTALLHSSSSTLLHIKTDAGADFSSAAAGLEGTALMIGDGALSLHG